MEKFWGIDLGGTKIEGVVLASSEDDKPLCRLRVDTDAHKGCNHIIGRISHLVDLLANEIGERPSAVGVGTPGVLDTRTGLLKNSNTTCLNGKPLKQLIETSLGIDAILANDANCFALAETMYGAARGARSTFGVIMGTGVGGGIVLEKRARYGLQGIAGEWGHNEIEENGAPCYCGKSGCVETVISGPALERYYTALSGQKRQLQEIVDLHLAKSDSHATTTVERLMTFFGKAISVVINILDPEVIVLGGGVSNVDALYNEGLEQVKKFVFNNRLETKIVKHCLGDSAGVFGAACLTIGN